MPVYFTGQTGPALPLNSIQYNSGPGQFAGDANLTWVPASGLTNKKRAAIGSLATINGSQIYDLITGSPAVFSNSITNEETFTDLSADQNNGIYNALIVNPAIDYPFQYAFALSNQIYVPESNANDFGIVVGTYNAMDVHGTGHFSQVVGNEANPSFGSFNSALGGTADDVWGYFANPFVGGAAHATRAIGITVAGVQANSTAIVDSAMGVQVRDSTKDVGASIPLLYGIKVENQTVGTTNYSVYLGTGLYHLDALTASRPVFTDASKNLISAQGASVADATDNATAITQLNALISRLEGLNILATV